MAKVRLHPTRSLHGPSGPRSNSKAGIVRFRVDGTLLPREKCHPPRVATLSKYANSSELESAVSASL